MENIWWNEIRTLIILALIIISSAMCMVVAIKNTTPEHREWAIFYAYALIFIMGGIFFLMGD